MSGDKAEQGFVGEVVPAAFRSYDSRLLQPPERPAERFGDGSQFGR